MDLKTLVEKSKQTDEVKKILSHKGYLCAVHNFAIPGQGMSEIKISFYDPSTNEITGLTVDSNGARVDTVDKPLRNAVKDLHYEKAKVDVNAAMGTALNEVKKKFGQTVQKVLVSLTHDNAWSFVCITKSFSTINVLVDAENGKILEAAEDSLI